jgi:iron complex transport system ATP-binding protein
VGGRDLDDMSRTEAARHIGYVPQHRADEEMVVFDAVLLGRKPHIRWAATSRDMEITEQVIAQTGLSPLAMRPVNRLSGGEAQKVIIARALAQEPKVLLLDEPTNSLDVRNQLEIMGILGNLTKARGLVTIVSIHDLNLALRFADRFLLIKDGFICSAVDRNHLSPEMIGDAYGIEVVLSEIAGFPIAVPVNDTEELTLNKETA